MKRFERGCRNVFCAISAVASGGLTKRLIASGTCYPGFRRPFEPKRPYNGACYSPNANWRVSCLSESLTNI